MVKIWSNRNSHRLLMAASIGKIISDNTWALSIKFKHMPTLGFKNITSRQTPKKNKCICSYGKKCVRMFIAALFIAAQNWKLWKCPSIIE